MKLFALNVVIPVNFLNFRIKRISRLICLMPVIALNVIMLLNWINS